MALYLGNTMVSLTSGLPTGGIDTSDATATASTILNGKTAYVKGKKVTGTCTYDADTSDATATAAGILNGKTAYVAGKKVTGTYTPSTGLDTSDATATSSDIASGKTAYVDGQKVTGNIAVQTGISYSAHSDSTVKPVLAINSDGVTIIRNTLTSTQDMLVRKGDLSVALLAKNYGDALAKDVLSGKTFTSTAGAVVAGTCTYDADTSDATATASSILSGQTAYVAGKKVTGTYTPSAGLDTSDATATASTILSGKTAYVKGSKVTGTCTYDANTSDATATASTILSGKTAYIKGSKVTGTCTYNCNSSDATATSSDIASGKTAYVNGKKVTGTLDVKTELLNYAYPVGSIYMSVKNTSPQSFLGGTWVSWGSGRVPVGVNTNDTNFNNVEKTGGASTVANALIQHTHTITASGTATSAGAHTHGLSMLFEKDAASGSAKNRVTPAPNGSQSTSDYTTKSAGAHTHSVTVTATAGNAGSAASNSTHNNLQPYITCYMWKRTA